MPDLLPYDDKELLNSVAAGDEQAFRLLFERYRMPFYTACLKLSGAREVAEEVVQETFIRIWEKRAYLRELEQAKGYLYQVFRNVLFAYFRQLATQKKKEGAILEFYGDDGEEGIHEKIRMEARLALIQDTIQYLTPQQAEVFRLIRLEGLSRNEAAQRLGISPNTVRNLLAGATNTLRAKTSGTELAVLFFLAFTGN